MRQRSDIRTSLREAGRGAASALIIGLALLGASPVPSGAAEAGATSAATQALANQTQRVSNDMGQFYLVWWIPPALSQAILRDTPNAQFADRDLKALAPYLVFALSRGQVGEHGLVELHDQADLLHSSRLNIDGKTITAVEADQHDAGALEALERIKPALASMLGRYGRGIEFALYRPAAGAAAPDPSLVGSIEYKLYHKHFYWQLPVWAPAAPPVAVLPAPGPAPAPAPVALTRAPPPVPLPLPAAPLPPAPQAPPLRKIDPTSGEEFPERYNFNPYTGQKLVSQ